MKQLPLNPSTQSLRRANVESFTSVDKISITAWDYDLKVGKKPGYQWCDNPNSELVRRLSLGQGVTILGDRGK